MSMDESSHSSSSILKQGVSQLNSVVCLYEYGNF